MRLLISLVLALLACGAWAQSHSSFFHINSETDLLALPSDQLIPSDINHEAVESIVSPNQQNFELFENPNFASASETDLPFGARLPGYDRIQYAYGYQIPERNKPQRTHLLTSQPNFSRKRPSIISPFLEKKKETFPVLPNTTEIPTTTPVTITTSTSTTITAPWFQSIYFPQPPSSKLSLPVFEHSPSEIVSPLVKTPPRTSLEANSDTKNIELSLADGYLPPILDFKTEPPTTIVTPPVDSYLPPNPDHISNALKTQDKPLSPFNSYLPPKPNAELDIPNNENSPVLLVESSYLPPNPDPVSKVHKPDESYLPPNLDPVLKVPEPDETYLPPNLTQRISENSPSLIPIAPLPVKSDSKPILLPLSLIREQQDPALHFGHISNAADPFGVIGEHRDQILYADEKITQAPPFGVIGEHEEHSVKFTAETPRQPPTGVIAKYDTPPVEFTADIPEQSPTGVIGEYQDPHIRFTGETQIHTPTAVISTLKDPAIRFEADSPNVLPTGVVAEHKEIPIRFESDTPDPSPTAVIGEHKDHHIRFTAGDSEQPPTAVVGEHKDQPVRFIADIPKLFPTGVLGKHKEKPIRFTASRPSPLPIGVVGEHKERPIKSTFETINHPPTGVIGEYEEQPVRYNVGTTAPSPDPIGAIREIMENVIIGHSGGQSLVVGAIPKDNPECIKNEECSEDQACIDSMCVNACVIAIGLCIGNAECHTKRHVPGCVCPDMFTAVTVKGYNQDQYDCMRMAMMTGGRSTTIIQGLSSSGRQRISPIANHRQNFGSLPAIGVLSKLPEHVNLA